MDQARIRLGKWVTRHSGSIALLLILFVSLLFRLPSITRTEFIMNDGGMFFVMVKDLQENSFRLPSYTSYNFSSIPYAYPPLSFFTIGIIQQYLQIDLIQLFRFIPLIFNLFSILAFFWLCQELTSNNKLTSLVATYYYSILPSSYLWLITGGGVTRSPAQMYYLFSLAAFLSYARTKQKSYLGLSGFTAGLMVNHHLEYAWIWALSIIILTIRAMEKKKWLTEINALFLLAGVLILPYLLAVTNIHGITPYLNAFTSGDFNLLSSIVRLVTGIFTEESIVQYLNVVALLGIFVSLIDKKSRRITIWLLVLVIFNNRSAFRSILAPLSILAAMGVIFFYKAILLKEELLSQKIGKGPLYGISVMFLAFSLLYPGLLNFLGQMSQDNILSSITQFDQQAMKWINLNTPISSEFIVLDSSESWITDKRGEWLPALAERKVVSTVQGTEWLPDQTYQKAVEKSKELRECIRSNNVCPTFWESNTRITPRFVYIQTNLCTRYRQTCQERILSLYPNFLSILQVYSNPEVEIFQLAHP